MNFTTATALLREDDTWRGTTSPSYWNRIGPFGGWIAAVLLRAVLDDPAATAPPLSVSINFAAAIREGDFTIAARELRRNRSTAFWFAEFVQRHDGSAVSCATATVVLAQRRPTVKIELATSPAAAAPETLRRWPRVTGAPVFFEQYDVRYVRGDIGDTESAGTTVAWVRDRTATSLDMPALIALCDIGLPQIFYQLRRPVPISTITMNVFVHAAPAELAAIGADFLLYESSMRRGGDGFFDTTMTLWSRAGALLATTEQIVWFKDE